MMLRAARRCGTRGSRAALAAALLSAVVGLAASGCTGRTGGAPVSAAADSVARATRARALINAGNEAYREGDFRLAARRYASAAVIRDDDPAAYYGLGMALAKLGRDEDARVAYSRARELATRQRGP